MATTVTKAKQAPPRGKSADALPRWVTVSLVVLLGILIYGLFVPKQQSAFDLPAAQTNQTSAPWIGSGGR